MIRNHHVKVFIALALVLALAFPILSATAGPLLQETPTAVAEETPEETAEAEETPTVEATEEPIEEETVEPTAAATEEPTEEPIEEETVEPTVEATEEPTGEATEEPTAAVTETVTATVTVEATGTVTATPTVEMTGTVTATVEATETVTATPEITATGTVTATPTAAATPAAPAATPAATRSEAVTAAMTFTPTGEMTATVSLINGDGDEVGTAQLTAVEVGEQAMPAVLIRVELQNLAVEAAGPYGLHIHETGECELPDFESAGDHFNPTDRSHGFLNPDGPHAGDLPMIRIEADGSALYEWVTALVSLTEGETNLLDEDGSALVIHADLDDYLSDPSGNSGERLACGVIMEEGEMTATPAAEGTPEGTPAVEQTPAAEGTPTPQAEEEPEQTPEAAGEAAVVAGMSGADNVNILVSTLTDYIVVDQAGDTLGQIDHAVIDAQSGHLYYVIIEYGGFLDIGEQTIAIPVNALQWLGGEQVMLPVEGDPFEAFPEIEGDWPVAAGAEWDAEVRSFWQQAGVEEVPGMADASAVARTGDLVGAEVAGISDTGGTISDIVLDLAQNQVRYVLLDLGAESLLAVPWQAIRIAEGETLALDADLDVTLLQDAPGLTRDTPGLLTEPDWDDALRNFWAEAGYEFEQAVEDLD